mgnify:FL=1
MAIRYCMRTSPFSTALTVFSIVLYVLEFKQFRKIFPLIRTESQNHISVHTQISQTAYQTHTNERRCEVRSGFVLPGFPDTLK